MPAYITLLPLWVYQTFFAGLSFSAILCPLFSHLGSFVYFPTNHRLRPISLQTCLSIHHLFIDITADIHFAVLFFFNFLLLLNFYICLIRHVLYQRPNHSSIAARSSKPDISRSTSRPSCTVCGDPKPGPTFTATAGRVSGASTSSTLMQPMLREMHTLLPARPSSTTKKSAAPKHRRPCFPILWSAPCHGSHSTAMPRAMHARQNHSRAAGRRAAAFALSRMAAKRSAPHDWRQLVPTRGRHQGCTRHRSEMQHPLIFTRHCGALRPATATTPSIRLLYPILLSTSKRSTRPGPHPRDETRRTSGMRQHARPGQETRFISAPHRAARS